MSLWLNNKKMKKRKNFSSFDTKEAFKELGIDQLKKWGIKVKPFQASKFFQKRMDRLEAFDLTNSESAKELLIDAFCEEAIESHKHIKIWKSASLQSDGLTGIVDYIVAPRRAYLDTPLLCIAEAKKDDFEKGMAQCLVEMEACQWNNEQSGAIMDIFGIVTNGGTWQFYKLTTDKNILETIPYSIAETNIVLGILHYIFTKCEEYLIKKHLMDL